MAESMPVPAEAPEPTLRGVMMGSDRTPLAFARWEHPAPRGRVVISHGYGEHGERYAHTARWLNQLGWSVSTMDHRGFGRSGGVRGDARGIRPLVEDLTHFLRQERMYDAGRAGRGEGGSVQPAPAFPQILAGHSFGGLVALLVLLWHPETLEGLVLTSPAVTLREIPLPMKILKQVLGWVAPHRPLNLPGNKAEVCSDLLMVQQYQQDPHCHRFISAGLVAAMAEGRKEILGFGAELDRPILLLEAAADVVVDPDGSEALWTTVRPGLLERHRLEGFYHEVFHDRNRAQAERLAALWLDRLFPPGEAIPALQTGLFEQGTP